ncbi:hypothetical protein SAMN05216553_12163 [Lentzea fradiae]|uniref:TrbL/VirB6 plasmid conjugal transfer protein n=1 Tax=Lentzea fradiae TaxID=200378 RepID=A0A1G8C8K0_9PSEU|nr:hypothetical protein [Lentzea fradiae]SDH41718.1 hypothetical protein SAMN05216553_12163 [Lentzea fradiae]
MTALTIVLAIAALLWARRRFALRVSVRAKRVGVVAALLALQVVMGAPVAHAQSCEPPNPERPGAGMVGALDPPVGNGLPGSPYLEYGYAGMVWHNYSTKCNVVPDASATLDTVAGNQLFSIGKNIVGATNALHYTVMGRGLLVPLDDAVKNGVQKVYDNVYLRWFGLVALLLAILMFRQIWTGDFATISKRGLWALAAMWLATSTLALPQFYNLLDNTLVSKTSEIQAGFIEAPEEQGTLHVLPTKLHDAVVYQSWLRGAFGTPEAPQAAEYGPRILKAQAWTTAEIAEGKDGDQAALDAKKNEWKALEGQLGTARGYFDGADGSRTGAGFLSLLQAIAFSLFQLFAKAAVLLAQLLLRILTLAGPLIGLVALIHHDLLRKVARAAAVTVFNVLVLAVLAGVHALLLQAIFNATGLSLLTRTLLGLMLTLVCFVIGKPLRRMWQMVEMSVGSASNVLPMSGGVWSKMMGRRKQAGPTPQDEFWESVRENEAGEDVPQRGRNRVRPEASSPVVATAQRLDRDAQASQLTGGRDSSAVRSGALPAGSGPATALPAARSRVVDSPTVTDRQWDRVDDAVLVPSRSNGTNGYVPVQEPRRAETEVVAGRPVHVIYRPSRGFEVRDNS